MSALTGNVSYYGAGINGEIPEVVGLDDLSGGYVDNLPCGIYAVQDDLTSACPISSPCAFCSTPSAACCHF